VTKRRDERLLLSAGRVFLILSAHRANSFHSIAICKNETRHCALGATNDNFMQSAA
jgi:hypothetical protein